MIDKPLCLGHSARIEAVYATWRLAVKDFPRQGGERSYQLCDVCVEKAIVDWKKRNYRVGKIAL